jgi:hypothetical protein
MFNPEPFFINQKVRSTKFGELHPRDGVVGMLALRSGKGLVDHPQPSAPNRRHCLAPMNNSGQAARTWVTTIFSSKISFMYLIGARTLGSYATKSSTQEDSQWLQPL